MQSLAALYAKEQEMIAARQRYAAEYETIVACMSKIFEDSGLLRKQLMSACIVSDVEEQRSLTERLDCNEQRSQELFSQSLVVSNEIHAAENMLQATRRRIAEVMLFMK